MGNNNHFDYNTLYCDKILWQHCNIPHHHHPFRIYWEHVKQKERESM